jgi:hypothetical protein
VQRGRHHLAEGGDVALDGAARADRERHGALSGRCRAGEQSGLAGHESSGGDAEHEAEAGLHAGGVPMRTGLHLTVV